MYNIWYRNMFQQTNVHEYYADIQNNNIIDYKMGPKTPEIFSESQIITSFEDLKITEWPGEIEVQQYENNSPSVNTKKKNKHEAKEKAKRKKEPKKTKKVKRRTVHDPISIHHIPLEPEDLDSFDPFVPVLRRKKKKNGICTPNSLIIDKDAKMNGYESDETINDYVACGSQGMCKCRRMQGREYYADYIQMKCRDYLKLYSHEKRVFPRGTVLHFTGALENVNREDLYQALKELDATIQFMDYQQGNTEGWVRLSYPYEARIVIKRMEDRKLLRVGGSELIFNVLSGKKEKKYLKSVAEAMFALQESVKNRRMTKCGFKYA